MTISREQRERYRKIKSDLRSLVSSLSDSLPVEDVVYTNRLVEANEYGEALDNLVALIVNQRCALAERQYRAICDLASSMKMLVDEAHQRSLRELIR